MGGRVKWTRRLKLKAVDEVFGLDFVQMEFLVIMKLSDTKWSLPKGSSFFHLLMKSSWESVSVSGCCSTTGIIRSLFSTFCLT